MFCVALRHVVGAVFVVHVGGEGAQCHQVGVVAGAVVFASCVLLFITCLSHGTEMSFYHVVLKSVYKACLSHGTEMYQNVLPSQSCQFKILSQILNAFLTITAGVYGYNDNHYQVINSITLPTL